MKKSIYIIIATAAIIILSFSCESKSGQLVNKRKMVMDSFVTTCFLQYPDFETERVNKEGRVLSYYMLIEDETTYNLNPLTWEQIIKTHSFDIMSDMVEYLNTNRVIYKIYKEDSSYSIKYRNILLVPAKTAQDIRIQNEFNIK